MTRIYRRGGVCAAVLALLTCAVAACSNGGGSSNDDDVTLRMTVWTGDKTQLALFNSIGDAYTKTHSDIASIKFDVIPYDGYTTALTTQLSGGSPPDLAWITTDDVADYISAGALVNLTPTLEDTPNYGLDDLTPAATKLWQRDGNLYAYPFSTSPYGVFYNKDLLHQAGVTQNPEQLVAAGKWTWQNAEHMAARVAARTNKSGLVIRDWEYKAWQNLTQVWRGFGARPWSEDGKTCGFDTPEMNAAMTFLHNAIFKDHALPGPGTTADFFAGEAALTTTQISRATLLANHPFDWGIVPLPSGPAGDKQVIGQAGIDVLTKGKHVQQAADFLAFFTNPANSAKLAQFFPPARKSQLNAATLAKVNPLFTPKQLQAVVVNGIETGEVGPSHTHGAKLVTLVQSALDPMWKPDADISSVLAGVCTAIEPTLTQ